MDHVGRYTAAELMSACYAQKEKDYPLISIFKCSNPNGGSDLPSGLLYKPGSDVLFSTLKHDAELILGDLGQYEIDYTFAPDNSSLLYNIRNQFEKLSSEGFFLLREYARKGGQVTPQMIYFDCLRAKPENGFREQLYYPRKVDQEIKDNIEKVGKKIIISSLPGSGKTRAMYQYIHSNLKSEEVIVLSKKNIRDIIIRTIFLISKNRKRKRIVFFILYATRLKMYLRVLISSK